MPKPKPNLMKYHVILKATFSTVVTVEAESSSDALALAAKCDVSAALAEGGTLDSLTVYDACYVAEPD